MAYMTASAAMILLLKVRRTASMRILLGVPSARFAMLALRLPIQPSQFWLHREYRSLRSPPGSYFTPTGAHSWRKDRRTMYLRSFRFGAIRIVATKVKQRVHTGQSSTEKMIGS